MTRHVCQITRPHGHQFANPTIEELPVRANATFLKGESFQGDGFVTLLLEQDLDEKPATWYLVRLWDGAGYYGHIARQLEALNGVSGCADVGGFILDNGHFIHFYLATSKEALANLLCVYKQAYETHCEQGRPGFSDALCYWKADTFTAWSNEVGL